MNSDPSRYTHALKLIDAENAQDPTRASFGDQSYPTQLIYSHRMTAWLNKIEPNASEPLRLAVRCQHLRRWDIPRAQFPMTRPGYHQWRTKLAGHHAETAGQILQSVGYDEATIARVRSLIRKERLKTDAEAQTLEDVACLVFLENDFVEFAGKHDPEKIVDIVRKTWKKMSERGHALAMELAKRLPEAELRLVVKAIS